jgi:hypothetical protein
VEAGRAAAEWWPVDSATERAGYWAGLVGTDCDTDAGTPGKVVDTDKEQYHRLAKLTQKYHADKIPAIDWLVDWLWTSLDDRSRMRSLLTPVSLLW